MPKGITQKCQKQAEAKRDGVINPQNYKFKQFLIRKFDALKRYESTEVDRRTWLYVPSGTLWSTSSDTQNSISGLLPQRRTLNDKTLHPRQCTFTLPIFSLEFVFHLHANTDFNSFSLIKTLSPHPDCQKIIDATQKIQQSKFYL